jgi:hypothetical protein
MTAHPFHSPWSRLARAKENLAKLENGIKAFAERHPNASVIEPDPSGEWYLHKVKMTEALPTEFTHLTIEIVEALRAALDQAGYATAVISGNQRRKETYFPFAESGAGLATVIAGRCKDLPSDIVSLFRSFQPYKGGNDTLWALNRMAANAKHTLLVPIGTSVYGMRISRFIASGHVKLISPRWDSAKNEMIFARAAAMAELNYNLDFSFFVAFGNVPDSGWQASDGCPQRACEHSRWHHHGYGS